MLEIETDENSIKIIAPYKEAARHVKEVYQNLIEKTIKQCLKKESSISYGYMKDNK